MNLLGLHHVTAMASNARENLRFYSEVLGLRLVKKTVNFDDPTTYHFYFGDAVGTPGSILTFFPWTGLRRGRPGRGQVGAIAFAVSVESLDFWRVRLAEKKVKVRALPDRFGAQVYSFEDYDGLPLELVASSDIPGVAPSHPEIPLAHAIRTIHSVTLPVSATSAAQRVLTATMGYRVVAAENGRTRLTVGKDGPSTWVDLLADSQAPTGLSGAGTVHHVAFRAPDDQAQAQARRELVDAGFGVSPVMDRNYFHSIYYREPDGVLFEIATDPPGFLIDESADLLGQTLKLPSHYESHRKEISAALPVLTEDTP